MISRVLFGLVFSTALGGVGYLRKSLSLSGFCTFIVLGSLLFVGGGWAWYLLLTASFSATVIVTTYKHEEKRHIQEIVAKPGPRDWSQVTANMGIIAAAAALNVVYPHPKWFVVCLGAGAASAADTWATEVGVLSPAPRLISNWRVVTPGTSGAVSGLGVLTAVLASVFVPVIGVMLFTLFSSKWDTPATLAMMVSGSIGGLIGVGVDSVLGATLQATYYCSTCHKQTEQTIHRCGTVTDPVKGWKWLNNELVNFLCTMAGALTAIAVYSLLVPA